MTGSRGTSTTNGDAQSVRKVGRKCASCTHAEREAIDTAILGGASYQAVADRFGLSKPGVARHVNSHLSPAALALAESDRAPDLAGKVEGLLADCEEILDEAKAKGQGNVALAAIRECRPTIELLAKLTGALRDGSHNVTVNVTTNPEWLRIRAALADALAPYPEALDAVSAALLAVEGSPAPAPRAAISAASRALDDDDRGQP